MASFRWLFQTTRDRQPHYSRMSAIEPLEPRVLMSADALPAIGIQALDTGAYDYGPLAAAAIVYVDDDGVNDPGAQNPALSDPLEDGSREHPFDRVQEAIQAVALGGQVCVADGTYGEALVIDKSMTLLGAYDGHNWSLPRNPSAIATILDAAGLNQSVVGIHNADVTVDGFTITHGMAAAGGGVYCEGGAHVFRACRIVDNHTYSGYPTMYQGGGPGGGIYSCGASTLLLEGCTISDNGTGTGGPCDQGGAGGGVCCQSAIIKNCEISRNGTGGGGPGGYPYDVCSGSGGHGAGIYCSGSLRVENCTIVGNACGPGGSGYHTSGPGGLGGGIYGNSEVVIVNSILWGNTGSLGRIDNPYEDVMGSQDVYGCDVSKISYCDASSVVPGGTDGNLSLDPGFIGASSGNYRLGRGSPCINQGNNTAVSPGVTTDLDGNPRIAGQAVDMGAYEYESDIIPPAEVSGLTATPGDGQVALSWTNPDDADFAGVRILRKEGGYPANPTDGTMVYDGLAGSCVDTGLTNGTTYYYAAFSYDEVPNYSAGATVTATPVAENVAETVGYTTVFSSISTVANRRAVPVVTSEAGTIESISIYHQGGTGHAILAVYADAAGRPRSQLGVTDSTLINGTEGWQTIALQNPVEVSAGQTIWLAWVFENDPGMRWTEGAPGRAISKKTWSGGMPNNFGASLTEVNAIYSIYATYSTADVIPPGSVSGLTATSGDAQVALSWTNPDDADLAGVRILRKEGSYPAGPTDGIMVYDGLAGSCVDTGLTNGTTYCYTAFSYDEVPNYSAGATVTGTPVADNAVETVGYTTVFSNISTVANRRAVPVAVNQTGTIESISIYHQGGIGHAILAVYADAAGRPKDRLGVTDSTLINSTEGWQTIALQNPVAVSAGQTIWLAWVFENDPGMRWTEGAPGRAISKKTWSGGMPNNFGASLTEVNAIYSIYAMYRTDGEGR
jgi:hypothetical protein